MCPYSLDVAGGVQRHVLDLAGHLIADGHHVRVLAPASAHTPVLPFVDTVGGAVGVPYNGSVARISFGPVTAARVGSWEAGGGFDILHLHQPLAPSTSLLALWAATVPVVATWHSAQTRSRALLASRALAESSLERIDAHIAVSEDARRTLVDHLGGDAVVIPNGVDVAACAAAARREEWAGARSGGPPTLALVGRFDEPRKGAGVLAAALPALLAAHPGLRLLVAGRGDGDALAAAAGPAGAAVRCLGELDEDDKRSLMASADVVVAPQRGGESFGIVLVEAMAAGTPLVASDLPAFARVLDGGRLGSMFATGDPDDLARALCAVLADPAAAAARAALASAEVVRYDWSVVAAAVSAVYETVLAGHRSLPVPGRPGRAARERPGAREGV